MNSVNEYIVKNKKENVIGKLHSEIFPETHKQLLEYFQQICDSDKKKTILSHFLLDSKYYALNIFPIGDNLLALVADDRSEEVLSKRKTEESEEKYKSIFHNSTTAMMLIDPETGQIIDVNQAAENYSGYKKEQLKTMNICQINMLDIKDVLEKMRLSQNGSQTYFELKHHTADGKILDIEVYTSKFLDKGKTLLITIVHDITNKKRAEKENIKLSQVVHQSPVSIVITDPNGLIEYSNPNNCKTTGYKIEELIGQNPRILKSGKFTNEEYSQLWKTIKADDVWIGEFYNKKKDGSFYWEYARIRSITDPEGRITNYVKIGEDITSRKKLENKLQHAKIKAEECDRLKTSFLANMSHEIRTPLNGILGFTNLIMDDDISSEIREKYGNTIKESADQLMMIIDDLVRTSQIEAGTLNIKYSKFNVLQLVNETINLFEKECHSKNITTKLITNFCKTYSCISDKKRIRQVLDNLIKNAIKFTDTGQISLSVSCKKTHLQFSIEDTGIGIKPVDQKIIFDRFRQLDTLYARQFEGNGLGLSISKEIVELLGGEIWVESEYGKGSIFQFTIPLEQDFEINETSKEN
jgi:PAS domain S-box-containing protein